MPLGAFFGPPPSSGELVEMLEQWQLVVSNQTKEGVLAAMLVVLASFLNCEMTSTPQNGWSIAWFDFPTWQIRWQYLGMTQNAWSWRSWSAACSVSGSGLVTPSLPRLQSETVQSWTVILNTQTTTYPSASWTSAFSGIPACLRIEDSYFVSLAVQHTHLKPFFQLRKLI